MSMWDNRFAQDGYVFGTAPAAFLSRHAGMIPPSSRILAVADGEGRNSVFLAGAGHDVVAMDGSSVGLDKARALAKSQGVTVDYRLGDVTTWDWAAEPFDAVVAIFIQFLPFEDYRPIFNRMKDAIKPGGLLMLHGYAPRQVVNGTGGPGDPAHMYTLPALREVFADFDVLVAEDYDAELDEGQGHSGPSALVDFIARKP